jgi:IS1 family transposase
MNILPLEKQIEIIAALTEGMSIRAVERLTGTHRDTVMRLGVRIGQGAARLHDGLMLNLQPAFIEMDEIWAYVGKKQRQLKDGDPEGLGNQYTFLALDRTGKAILSYRVGKRDIYNTRLFLLDLRKRCINAPQISSDAFPAYKEQVRDVFGGAGHYAQIVKTYVGEPPINAARRYSPGIVVAVDRTVMFGKPKKNKISTSFVERTNLTLRMQQRRFTRLTSGFSKKLENHAAAVSLFVAHYNLCRVHETIRMTPAMALGVTDHVWSIGDLIRAVSAGELPNRPGTQVGRFRVIDGGLS